MPPDSRTNRRAAAHVRGVGRVAGQPQRRVGLDRGGQVGRAAVEVRPGAVVALLGADPAGRPRAVSSSVRMPRNSRSSRSSASMVTLVSQLALPPAGGVLQAEQVVDGGARASRPRGRGIGRTGRRVGGEVAADVGQRVPSAVPVRDEAGHGQELGADVVRDVGAGQPAPRRRRARASASASAQARPPASSTSAAASTQRRRRSSGSGCVPAAPAGPRPRCRRRARRRPAASSCARAGRRAPACRSRSGLAPDAEQVVDELEGQAEVLAERRAAPRQPVRAPGQHRADRAGAGHQRAGLVRRHRQALLQR